MSLRKSEWPETGDLVMATVENVTDFGAYVKLDEYNKREGYFMFRKSLHRGFVTFAILFERDRSLF